MTGMTDKEYRKISTIIAIISVFIAVGGLVLGIDNRNKNKEMSEKLENKLFTEVQQRRIIYQALQKKENNIGMDINEIREELKSNAESTKSDIKDYEIYDILLKLMENRIIEYNYDKKYTLSMTPVNPIRYLKLTEEFMKYAKDEMDNKKIIQKVKEIVYKGECWEYTTKDIFNQLNSEFKNINQKDFDTLIYNMDNIGIVVGPKNGKVCDRARVFAPQMNQ